MPASRESETLAARESGTENETTIVFLHGGSVAGWMWEPQVGALEGEFHCLVPDLPGFGASNGRAWVSVDDAAAEVRELIAARGHGGRAHLVGLSLGAVVGLQVLTQDVTGEARVPSAVLSGTTANASPAATRLAARAQLKVWNRRWYWAAMARAYGIPPKDRGVFLTTGRGISVDTMTRVVDEVLAGVDLVALHTVQVPVLLVAGNKDARNIREGSLSVLADALPGATAVLAPGGHHHWNAEDPRLFNRMVRSWVLDGVPAEGLQPASAA